jgi:undecaprenyl-diphosphatase
VLRGIAGADPEGRMMALWLLLAMVPTAVFAMATRAAKETAKAHVWVYGACLVLTAAILYAANELSKRREGRHLDHMNGLDALAVGAIQGLGGGFGLSRSGSTIAIGAFRGLQLSAATRFSFFLGIPTIAAAALVEGHQLVKPLLHGRALPAEIAFPPGSASPALLYALGVAVAAVSGYAAIGLLDRFTRQLRLNGFAIYCLCGGALLLVLGLSR